MYVNLPRILFFVKKLPEKALSVHAKVVREKEPEVGLVFVDTIPTGGS